MTMQNFATGKPLPKIPGWMIPKVWGMPQDLLRRYVDLDQDGCCTIGGDKCLQVSVVGGDKCQQVSAVGGDKCRQISAVGSDKCLLLGSVCYTGLQLHFSLHINVYWMCHVSELLVRRKSPFGTAYNMYWHHDQLVLSGCLAITGQLYSALSQCHGAGLPGQKQSDDSAGGWCASICLQKHRFVTWDVNRQQPAVLVYTSLLQDAVLCP